LQRNWESPLLEPVPAPRAVVRLSLEPGSLHAKEEVEHEGVVFCKVPCTAVHVLLR
jgi:hypothetical protein